MSDTPAPTPQEQAVALWKIPCIAEHMQTMKLRPGALESALAALAPFGETNLGLGTGGSAYCKVKLPDGSFVFHQNAQPSIVALRCLKDCLESIPNQAQRGVEHIGSWLSQQTQS